MAKKENVRKCQRIRGRKDSERTDIKRKSDKNFLQMPGFKNSGVCINFISTHSITSPLYLSLKSELLKETQDHESDL